MANTHFTRQYNKIIIAGDVLMDLSADTVTAGAMLASVNDTPVTAHDKNGASITGTIVTNSQATVSVPTTGANAGSAVVDAGYYPSQVIKPMTAAVITLSDQKLTPTISITKPTTGTHAGEIQVQESGSVTVSATVDTPGFVSSIADTATVQIGTVATPTYTIGWTTAESLDSNLNAENVRAGRRIFQTTGTFTSDATASAGEILYGETAYVNGEVVTGTMAKFDDDTEDHVTITSTTDVAISPGYYDGSVKAGIDAASKAELIGSNILTGHTILGVPGTLEPSAAVTHGPVTVTAKFNASGTPQTIPPSSIGKQFIDSVTVNAISYSDNVQTSGTTGYTFTISNTF